jgi:HlyD family secretion protein
MDIDRRMDDPDAARGVTAPHAGQPTMRKRTVIAVILLAAAVAAGVLVPRLGPASVDVDVTPAARVATLQALVTASGEITAVRSADIGSSIMGRLVSLRVREGDRVKAGQTLAIIDPEQAASAMAGSAAAAQALAADAQGASAAARAAEADVAAARARLDDAEKTLRRTRDLHAQGLVAQQALDSSTAADEAARAQLASATAALRRAEQAVASASQRVTQARAEERRARDTFAKTRIEAPIDGVVTRLDVEEGEMVVMGVQNQPGTILMTVSDLSGIDAEVKVAEADVLRLDVHDPATVTLEALPGQTFRGRVVEVGASALPQVGTQAAAREFKVLVRLDDAGSRLRPGLTCDVEILVDERRNALVVPLQSVVERTTAGGARRAGVFIERGGTVTFTPVTRTGLIGGLSIEVDGIPDGARVVSGPIQALRDLADGARVSVPRP